MLLRTKFIIVYSLVTTIIGATAVIFITLTYLQTLAFELRTKGFSIARALSARAVEDILVDDYVSLYKLIDNEAKIEKDVRYVFILDQDGKVLAHTFEGGFPGGLLRVYSLDVVQNENSHVLDTDEGFIRDVSVPIREGSLGVLHLGLSEAHIREVMALGLRRLFAIFGLVTVGGIVITYLFVNKTTKPLSEMISAAKRIGESDFDTIVSVNSKDEVGQLAQTFNLMATKLKKTKVDLESAQEQLLLIRKLAAIGHFTSGVVHEINNPLDGIINCIHTLKSGQLSKKEREKYLDLAQEGLFRIETLTRRLLGLTNDWPHSLVPININELIAKALFFVDYRMKLKRITTVLNFTSTLSIINIDPGTIQQVLVNLFLNAIDSMAEDGKLSITTEADSVWLKISVADTGKGIPEENLDKIFLPFFTTKISSGIGLGLSICLNIIKQHRGEIEVKSKVNEGTIFMVKLPLDLK